MFVKAVYYFSLAYFHNRYMMSMKITLSHEKEVHL